MGYGPKVTVLPVALPGKMAGKLAHLQLSLLNVHASVREPTACIHPKVP